MSGSGGKHASEWDSKEDVKSGSYYHQEPIRFNVESSSGSKRSAAAYEQRPSEARCRSRVSNNNDDSYYSEQDDIRQQSSHRSGSRSRSPVYRARRDSGSYDRHKTRTRVSPPPPLGESNKKSGDHKLDQSSDYGWEDRIRKPRELREQGMMMMKGGRSCDYNTDFPEDNSRRHRRETTGENETQRRDGNGDGEREFHRSSNIPCKFFAAGFCRNGKHCRFSHHGDDRKLPQDNNFYRQENNNHGSHKWNDVERLDNGKFDEFEVPRASKGNPEPRKSWIDDMEMSPDWNYGVQSMNNPVKDGVGIIVQSSQSQVPKLIAAMHQSCDNPVNVSPVQVFNQNSQNHNVLSYQNSLTAGGSQQVVTIAAAAADVPIGLNLSVPKSGIVAQNSHHLMVEKAVPAQSTVTREQIDQITNISASIAQFLANGQQIKQALQIPLQSESSIAVQPSPATTGSHTQMSSNPNQLWGLGTSTCTESVPMVTTSQVTKVDGIQELAKTDEVSKEEEGTKTKEDTKSAENVVDEEDHDGEDDISDEENKKEKDPKGTRAFKFALVEIVKELLKPAWKEGKMNKEGYKNIVKKAVEKVTGAIQSGNIPQTQDKIDAYLSASKPKLTKLVQAYISKVKKT